jgi:hypothetical protein
MLKIKLCLIAAAIIGGVFGAVAHKDQAACESQQQYYKFGNTYVPVGQYGVDYVCYSSAGTCTYYLSNPFNPNSWTPCRTGAFSWLLK